MLRHVLLGVLAVALVAGVLALSSYVVLVQTDWGRAKVARYLEQQVNDAIHGELRIERIDRIEPPWVRAHGVQILAPDGVPAIDVRDVTLKVDLAALREGRLVWHRAEIDGGIVRVSEDKRGRVNMEETFKARHPEPPEVPATQSVPDDTEGGPLDLRTMVTSNMKLLIFGGSLPKLRMEELHGIMRVHVLPNGRVTLRFDEYRGKFVEGLPTGRLDFEDVKGHVETDQKRLLRFEGRGASEGEPVAFELDIFTEPKTLVKIDARFPRLSAESIATLAFAAYTRFTDNLELNVQPGELGGRAMRERAERTARRLDAR